jgi:hypothetical protein
MWILEESHLARHMLEEIFLLILLDIQDIQPVLNDNNILRCNPSQI